MGGPRLLILKVPCILIVEPEITSIANELYRYHSICQNSRWVLKIGPPTFICKIYFEHYQGIENPAFVDFIKNIETEETLVQVHDIESPSSETGKSH